MEGVGRTLIHVNRSIMDFQVFVEIRICIKYSEYVHRCYIGNFCTLIK